MNKFRKNNKPKKIDRIKRLRHQKASTSKSDIKGDECREFFEIVSDFIDLELTENQLINLRNHLTTCVHCTKVYRDFRVLIQLCQSESITEPFDVSSQLWQALEKRFKAKGF
jgi:hypothetical protein